MDEKSTVFSTEEMLQELTEFDPIVFKYYYDKNIKLPIYKYLSVDGEVYVYQNDEDGTQIGFWIHRGVLTGSEELMYSSNGEKLIKENETDHPIKRIKKLNKYWYYVITEY